MDGVAGADECQIVPVAILGAPTAFDVADVDVSTLGPFGGARVLLVDADPQ